MSKGQKIVTTALWAILVVVMVGVIGAGLRRDGRGDHAAAVAHDVHVSAAPAHLEPLFPVPAFRFVDQEGRAVTDESLRGGPWVAAFVFTRCAGPCPMMTQKMSALQGAVPDPRFKLVSFSVDPEYDTPAVLKDYAAKFGADADRWHLLTGEKDAIFATAAGMKLAAGPARDDNPIFHSDRFLLVDALGMVRGIYHSTEADDMTRLTADAATLLSEPPAP